MYIDVLLSKSSSLLLNINLTNCIYTCSNDDQGEVYLNCKFHDPRDMHYKFYILLDHTNLVYCIHDDWMKIMYNSVDVYQYKAHWLLMNEGVIMQLYSAFVDFYLFYDGLFICKYKQFWQDVIELSMLLKWLWMPMDLFLTNVKDFFLFWRWFHFEHVYFLILERRLRVYESCCSFWWDILLQQPVLSD